MPNYQQSTVTGTAWTRCRLVNIINPLNSRPCAVFVEERAMTIDGQVITNDAGNVARGFDQAQSIPLRNPETGELTGASVSQGELYTILYSLYMQTAIERDSTQIV